jgi:hypothetical protein
VFLNFPDQKIFSWEHRNIVGSPPPRTPYRSSAKRDPSKYKEK